MPVAATYEETALIDALRNWLPSRLQARSVAIDDLTRPQAGASAEKCVFTARWADARGATVERRFVMRIQPGEHSLFKHPDAVLEARIVQAIAGSVPVPNVLAVEPDPEVVGSPFYLMEFVEGRVPPDIPSCHLTGWVTELTSQERATHWDNGLRVMAGINRIPAEPDLGFLADPSATTPLAALVAATRDWHVWAAQGRDCGVIDDAMRYVEAQMPPHEDAFLAWGDARVGNILFKPDGCVAAALDWEMAALGPAEVDLGWWLMMEEFYGVRMDAPPLDGVPSEAATVARFEELVGRPMRELTYYKVLAALRFAIVILRARDKSVAAGLLPETATLHTHNPVTQMLAEWLGLPVPDLAPEYAYLQARYAESKV